MLLVKKILDDLEGIHMKIEIQFYSKFDPFVDCGASKRCQLGNDTENGRAVPSLRGCSHNICNACSNVS